VYLEPEAILKFSSFWFHHQTQLRIKLVHPWKQR